MKKVPARWSKEPTVIKKGSTSVTIYYTPNNGTEQYTLAYYLGGKRKRKRYSDFSEAKEQGHRILQKLSTGDFEALRLSGEERSIYVHATRTLESAYPGVSLLQAVEEYVTAKRLLPEMVSLTEPCREYAQKRSYPERTPGEVLEELIQSKRGLSVSDVYLRDLQRLNRFAKAFTSPIISIQTAQIEIFLDNLKMAPRTRNNYRRNLITLYQFAEQRGYLPKSCDVMDGVGKAKETDQDVEVFSPKEIRTILTYARKEMISFFSIAAFGGLRTAEIQRLDWSEIDLSQGHIEVIPSKSKTASRRLVPIRENLRRWLELEPKKNGPIILIKNVAKQISELVSRINDTNYTLKTEPCFSWKHNGLRHSYISYRLAELQDSAKVAYEAGNSPNVVFKNYRKVVTPSKSQEWFSITPDELKL